MSEPIAVPPGFDLERIVPDLLSDDDPVDRETLECHLERYRFASRHTKNHRVLDIACGVGYGSSLLGGEGAQSVLGVDLDGEAIDYATQRYSTERVSFAQGDGNAFVPPQEVDVVVSLETIEHVGDARGFVRRLASLLAPGGLLIGSVPTTLSTDVNPYHLHDFSSAEFRALFREVGLEIIDELQQRQSYTLFSLRDSKKNSRRKLELRPRLPLYYATHPRMFIRRILTTLTKGLSNEYLVLVGRKP